MEQYVAANVGVLILFGSVQVDCIFDWMYISFGLFGVRSDCPRVPFVGFLKNVFLIFTTSSGRFSTGLFWIRPGDLWLGHDVTFPAQHICICQSI